VRDLSPIWPIEYLSGSLLVSEFSNAFFKNVLQRLAAKHQRASYIQHWNMLRAFAGLKAFLLRSRSLSGGFKRLTEFGLRPASTDARVVSRTSRHLHRMIHERFRSQ